MHYDENLCPEEPKGIIREVLDPILGVIVITLVLWLISYIWWLIAPVIVYAVAASD